ncbi:MAG: hypothetical protein ACT4P3_22280, partial [Betaproteobacteria bacterium]
RWVNVGRLSVATVYEASSLNVERGEFGSSLARPGSAAPDAPYGAGFFVDQLGSDFRTVFFRPQERQEPLYSRYGVPAEGATYVFRPDGHVLARCAGIDEAFAREAVRRVLDYRPDAGSRPASKSDGEGLNQLQIDRLYDAFSEFFEGRGDRALVAKCVEAADKTEDSETVRRAIRNSGSGQQLIDALSGNSYGANVKD